MLLKGAPAVGSEGGFGDGGPEALATRDASLLLFEEVPCRLRAPAMLAMPLLPPLPKLRKASRAALPSCLLPCAPEPPCAYERSYPGAPGRPGRSRSSVIPMCVSSTSSNSRTSVTPCLRRWAITSGMQY